MNKEPAAKQRSSPRFSSIKANFLSWLFLGIENFVISLRKFYLEELQN